MNSTNTKVTIIFLAGFISVCTFSASAEDKPPASIMQKIPCETAAAIVKQIYTRAYDIAASPAAVDSVVPVLETSISSMRYIRAASGSCSKVDNFLSYLESALSRASASEAARYTSRSSVNINEEPKNNSGGGRFSGEIKPRVSEDFFNNKKLEGGTRVEQVIHSE